jgi:protein-disulfide isomerase
MTGTALTEAEEFNKIYKIEVLPVPMNLEYQALRTDATLEDIRKSDPEFYSWYTALPVTQLSQSDGHMMGSPKAPVTIVEFSDFECAYCSRNHVLLNQLLERRPGLVRVVYRHFPLDTACNEGLESSVHTRACRAAEAAECAAQQGRFHEMANDLFSNQRRLFENYLFTLAERADLDMNTFRACMSEHSGRDAILTDTREGNRLKVTSTPTLFINGRQVVGTLADLDRYDYAVLIESRLLEIGVNNAVR